MSINPFLTPADAQVPSRVRYLVLNWLCLAALISYIPRNCISVAESTIRTGLDLQDRYVLGIRLTPEDQMAQVMSSFFLTYALCQLPAGWLAHIWGTRRCLPLFALAWSAASALGALAPGVFWLIASRMAMGAAQAGIFACCAISVASWFPLRRRALANGCLASSMSIGGAVAAFLTGLLLDFLDWRWLLFLYAVPGAVWAIGFYLWFRDSPEEHPAVNAAELSLLRDFPGAGAARHSGVPAEPTPWRGIVASPAMWLICGQQFFRGAGYIFFASWFPTYLQETRGVSVSDSGYLTSLPMIGVVLGSLLGGLGSDWLQNRTGSRRVSRQGFSVVTSLLAALLIVLTLPIEDAGLSVLIISGGAFFAAFAGPCAYTITIDMGGKHVATVFSTMNMAGNLGAMVFPLAVPPLLRFSGHDWDVVIFVFAGIYVGAALFWLLLNPNGTIFDRNARG